jgi:hypothetical protein
VARELVARLGLDRSFIGHQMRLAVDLGDDRLAQRLGGHVGDMARANFALALDQREKGFLALAALLAGLAL